MATAIIDIVMQDLSFLEDAQNEPTIREQLAARIAPREQIEKPTFLSRLSGFLELVR